MIMKWSSSSLAACLFPCIVVVLEFERSEYSVSERNGSLSYCVVLSGPIDLVLGVHISLVAAGSAQEGADFEFSPTTLIFQPLSATRICQSVNISQDSIIEPDEAFFLILAPNISTNIITTVDETEVIILDATDGPIYYLNASNAVPEGEEVLLCLHLPLSVERNVTAQILFHPFGSESLQSLGHICESQTVSLQ